MKEKDRKAYILERIEEKGTVFVSDLVKTLKVSEMTVRRDLAELENMGLVRRNYGKATSARGRSFEPTYQVRILDHTEEKAILGKAAADFILDGDSIALDVGSTLFEVAKNVLTKQNLTVVTTNLHIAYYLLGHSSARIIVPGGILRKDEGSLVGNITESALKDFFVDRFFMGVGGIDAKAGFTDFNLEDSNVKKLMIRNAKEVIVVADSSKFGKIAFTHISDFKYISRLITDKLPPSALLKRLQDEGVEITLAKEMRRDT